MSERLECGAVGREPLLVDTRGSKVFMHPQSPLMTTRAPGTTGEASIGEKDGGGTERHLDKAG